VRTYCHSGGAFNIIVHILLKYKKRELRLVLRIPKVEMEPTIFHNVVVSHTFISSRGWQSCVVPKIILYDVTTKNSLESQYWLMTYVNGDSLYDVFDKVDRCQVAVRVATMMIEMFQSKYFPHCGPLVRDSTTGQATVGTLELAREDTLKNVVGPMQPPLDTSTLPTDLSSFFAQRFRSMEQCVFEPELAHFCGRMASDMVSNFKYPPGFKSKGNCLVHPDFFARNLVHTPYRLGVVDWDHCEVLPCKLAFFVPGWLWNMPDLPSDDVDGYDPRFIPDNDIDQKVRQVFLDTIEAKIPGYCEIVEQARTSGLAVLGHLARFPASTIREHSI